MELHQLIRKTIIPLILITFICIFLNSCKSKEPITTSVSGPPAGQNVTVNQRAYFAKDFGDRFRAKFGESEVWAQGMDDKTLVIKWIHVSRPYAAEFVASEEIVKDLREMGFKRLILTDGNKSNWDVDLKN